MANFDFRGRLTLDPARSQIARGGFGAVENCTWGTTSDTLFDFGYGDHSPADLRILDNELEGLGAYAGGESWERNLRVIAFLAPDLAAAASIEYPADVAARIRELGAQGEEVHWAGWCTRNAVWTAGNLWGGISHAGRTVFADSGGIAVWNVWTGYLVYQVDAFWNAAYDGGGILVFQRSLTGGFLMALSDLEQIELRDKLRQVWSQLCKDPVDDVGTSVTGMIENLYRRPAVDLAPLSSALARLEAELGALPGKLQAPAVTATAVVPPETLTPVLAAVAAAQAAIDSTRAGVDELLGHHAHGNVP